MSTVTMMTATPRYVRIVQRAGGAVVVERARWCSDAWCRFRGLQLRRRLAEGEALLLVHPADGVALSAIHMFFVFFPIAAIWIESGGRVVEARIARPWRPYYGARAPAKYVLESSPEILDRVQIGDELDIIDRGDEDTG
jgi:uncharacterized membrane protein (UPF0127 family)